MLWQPQHYPRHIHWLPVTVYLFSQSVIWCIKVTQIWIIYPDSIPLLADSVLVCAYVAYVIAIFARTILRLLALFSVCSQSSYCPSVSLSQCDHLSVRYCCFLC